MSTLIHTIVNAGVVDLDEWNRSRIKRLNIIALTFCIVSYIIGIFLYATSEQLQVFIISFIKGSAYLVIPLCNKYRKHNLACFVLIFTHDVAALYYGTQLSSVMETSLLGVFSFGPALLVLERKDLRILCLCITLFLIVFLETNKFYHFVTPLTFPTPMIQQVVRYMINGPLMAINIIIVMYCVMDSDFLYSKLKSASLFKSVFLRETSHEIRNPLNAISGISQLLIKEVKRNLVYQPIESLVKQQYAASYNVTQIVDNILELSKIEEGKQDTIQKEIFNLKNSIENIMLVYQYLADLRSVKLVLNYTVSAPQEITFDKNKLTQVINNLLINAIKFTTDNSTVSITVQMKGKLLLIQVSDQGPGISQENITKIFQPFVTSDSSFIKSTGLGLTIVKRFTALLDGEISVTSQEGAGSIFMVTFPLEAYRMETPFLQVNEEEMVWPIFQGKKVLILEDDRMSQIVLKKVLSDQGFQLRFAENGHTGLELAHTFMPDIILLDLHMPGMTGKEILMMLKASPSLHHIPVIAVSGDAFKESLEEILQAGASGYMVKPFQIDHIYHTLANALSGSYS
jgi:signal transduction histidine kinase/CheY-like chemotaxis protein